MSHLLSGSPLSAEWQPTGATLGLRSVRFDSGSEPPVADRAALLRGAVARLAAFRAGFPPAARDIHPAGLVASLLGARPALPVAQVPASQARGAPPQSQVFRRFAEEIRILSP